MSDFLFPEFNETSSKEWKNKIQFDLKGADYNEALIWKSNESIHVKPFYHKDEFPEGFPPISGQPDSWSVCQSVFIDDADIANKLAINALSRGAEALCFTAAKSFSIEKLFKSIHLDNVYLYIDLQFFDKNFILELQTFFFQKEATVFILIDVIGNLAKNGNWFTNMNQDFEALETILKNPPSNTHLISIDTALYQNAGATIVQQLAYAMAHANEYLNRSFCNPEATITFKISVGSNYFFEIAKLRALRKLYAALAQEYSVNPECHILAMPSKRNKTLYDYNANMLRTTTECMSAVLGGANTVCNLPYDALYHKSNEFGERISRNQLLILKNESYFDAVSNPTDGSYYIESLTEQLAEKALALFKEIEKGGGFLKELKDSTIQKKVKESAAREQEQFDNSEKILLGTNKHPNKNDRMKNDLELFPFVKTNPRKTLIEPIIERRLAEKTEQERLKNEE